MAAKVCTKCGEEKDANQFDKGGFRANGEQKYDLKCKSCRSLVFKQTKGSLVPHKIVARERLKTHKTCTKCKIEKELSEFNNGKWRIKRLNLHADCKKCQGIEGKKWRESKLPPPYRVLDLPGEIWKRIPVMGSYMISSPYGRIKTIQSRWFRNEMILKTRTGNISDYPSVKLTYKKKEKVYVVHRLLAQAFIPNPENKPEVNHIDGDKINYHISNLEWVTKSENRRHALDVLNVRVSKGQDHYSAKITNDQALEIFNSDLSVKDLVNKYNVGEGCVRDIKNGKNWVSITGAKYIPVRKNGDELVSMVMDICFSETRPKDLCKKYNMPYPTLKHIRRGGSYSDISGIKYKNQLKNITCSS